MLLEVDPSFIRNINTLYDKESKNKTLPNLKVSIRPLKKKRE